jgi:hypothetical protein
VKKISVNGRQFAYEVRGTGSPTVVLETGIGAESGEWGAVANAHLQSALRPGSGFPRPLRQINHLNSTGAGGLPTGLDFQCALSQLRAMMASLLV